MAFSLQVLGAPAKMLGAPSSTQNTFSCLDHRPHGKSKLVLLKIDSKVNRTNNKDGDKFLHRVATNTPYGGQYMCNSIKGIKGYRYKEHKESHITTQEKGVMEASKEERIHLQR